ncbi:hypothetical protein [Desulfonatronospira sp.]|uniref:ribonuclease toxin HepT-like protein n=1 Tax=Desulfonatronospira sp. TaxID=1962951 RepID=UPI0025B9A70F|nr:hypothetical protein [Desulfonatronospira sp.]
MAVMVAGLIENYYTCAETIFFRISQFFDNNLQGDRWHRELLERMTLDIGETRPKVISEQSFSDLTELMRFRHFKRYYFGVEYDWERVEALVRRVDRLAKQLPQELSEFAAFVRKIAEGKQGTGTPALIFLVSV